MTADPGPLRVLVVHNRYQQAGGEDSVFAAEVALLRNGGCLVETLTVSNEAIQGATAKFATAARAIYNPAGRAMLARKIARFVPDVVHVHNFFPQLSPSVFDACAAARVPAVWTLHNFRIACANGLLFRDGRPCEDCVGRLPLPAVVHRCYRGSLAGSATAAAMIGWHRIAGTWRNKVARFIVLSAFAREIVLSAGVPADRIAIKPNFVEDPPPTLPVRQAPRSGALFVGRLSVEKGAAVMIEAWRRLPDVSLTILGDGPERAALEAAAPANVRFAGLAGRDVVRAAMRSASALIVPSICYETFGLVVAEAMALGTPVIASSHGALATIVENGKSGLHFTQGDPDDLARKVRASFADDALMRRLGSGARLAWETHMRPDVNLKQLLAIYRDAIAVTAEERGHAA